MSSAVRGTWYFEIAISDGALSPSHDQRLDRQSPNRSLLSMTTRKPCGSVALPKGPMLKEGELLANHFSGRLKKSGDSCKWGLLKLSCLSLRLASSPDQ